MGNHSSRWGRLRFGAASPDSASPGKRGRRIASVLAVGALAAGALSIAPSAQANFPYNGTLGTSTLLSGRIAGKNEPLGGFVINYRPGNTGPRAPWFCITYLAKAPGRNSFSSPVNFRSTSRAQDGLTARMMKLFGSTSGNGGADRNDIQAAETSAYVAHYYDEVNKNGQYQFLGRVGTSVSDLNRLVAIAKKTAGPYTVTISSIAGNTKPSTNYTVGVTVRNAYGAVPGIVVTLSNGNRATTNSRGQVTLPYRTPAGNTAYSITASAAPVADKLIKVLGSQTTNPIIQDFLSYNLTPSTYSRTVTSRTRVAPVSATFAKYNTTDTGHKTPIAGATFTVTDVASKKVLGSFTTKSTVSVLPVGAVFVPGHQYSFTETKAPPGFYIPAGAGATQTFTIPANQTATFAFRLADPAVPTLKVATQVSVAKSIVGQRLNDSVLVSGNDNEAGVITATLYGPVSPVNGACTGVSLAGYQAGPAQKFSVPFTGNGTFTVNGPVLTKSGCYGWAETVRDTASKATATSPPTAPNESSITTQPAVATNVSATSVQTGDSVTDSIRVTGMNGQSGSLVATLLGPVVPVSNSCTAVDWTGAPTAGTATIPVNGDGTYTTPAVKITAPGCYTFVETLTPASTPNTPVKTPPGQPTETLLASTVSITTAVNRQTANAGDSLTDSVVLKGTNGTPGTITVKVLGPVAPVNNGCVTVNFTGASSHSLAPIPVTGDGTFTTGSYTVSSAGCYTFVETYTSTNGVITTNTTPGEASETTLVYDVHVTTAINHQAVRAGSTVHDTVVISGLGGQTGTVTGSLLGPIPAKNGSCDNVDFSKAATVAAIPALSIKGDGSYTTGDITVPGVGCYTFVETLKTTGGVTTVNTKPGEKSETTTSSDVHVTTAINHQTVQTGGTVHDTVVVSGTNGATGTVTGSLLGPIAPKNGSCDNVDFSKAATVAAIPALSIKGDGSYTTGDITVPGVGCYTFVETLKTTNGTQVVNTKPGEHSETTLASRPASQGHIPSSGGQINTGLGADKSGSGVSTTDIALGGGAALVALMGLVLMAARRRRITE